MDTDLSPTRRLPVLLIVALVALLPGCGQRAEQRAPHSPVGRFEVYQAAGFEREVDGTPQPEMEIVGKVTITVRLDHTVLYEWKNLAEPGKQEGNLELTWRGPSSAESQRVQWTPPQGRWFLFAKGEPDRLRDPMETAMVIIWIGGNFWFPAVDSTSGQLQKRYWVLRPAGE